MITEYALQQNYPNPVENTTLIAFDVVEENYVRLDVFDRNGDSHAVLADDLFGNGRHIFEFQMAGLPNGFYEYRVEIGYDSLVGEAILAANRTILKNTSDPDALLELDPVTSTNSTGKFSIANIEVGRTIALRDSFSNDLGEATLSQVSLIAVKAGYLPSDTTLTISEGEHYVIDFTLEQP